VDRARILTALAFSSATLTGGLLIVGCGSGTAVDAGGFSSADLKAANTALSVLAQTSVWNAAAEVTYTNGNLPTSCSFHVARTTPLTFELFITWAPDAAGGAAPNRRYAWLEALIGPKGLRSGYFFHLGYASTRSALVSHYGQAYSKPVEKCLIEETGTFALVPR
jgi:hypothetical protein